MLSTASADALIACWDAKYSYNFWRPVTAIRAGDTDGNPLTAPDPTWIGVVATPNHPEYPAAHGCFSAAVTETLKHFFGSDEVCFSIDSNVAGLASPVRSYRRFSDALQEVLAARILWRDALSDLHARGSHPGTAGVPVHDAALFPTGQHA